MVFRISITFIIIRSFLFGNAFADVDLMVRGGATAGIWKIDISSSSYTSTRRGNNPGGVACASLAVEGEFFSLGAEYEKSFEEQWHYGDASESEDDDSWSSFSADKEKKIIFLGLGTTGKNLFTFLSMRIGYILDSTLQLNKNILGTQPPGTYKGNGVKISLFYKNIFETLDWGIDLSIDLNYINYDQLTTNGSSYDLPSPVGSLNYSELQETSASLLIGFYFTFLRDIFAIKGKRPFFMFGPDS